MSAKRMTLTRLFDPRSNSLNALRLVLAALVIVSHSWPLSGHEPEPAAGGANLGVWAVFGFFGISGYLVTRSRLNGRSALRYYRARALRILPAFLLCLLVVAFAFAPLSLLFDRGGSWNASSAVSFVVRNLALYPPNFFQGGIDGTLTTAVFPELWDGPLWTLFWEACCYIAIGVAVSVIPKRMLPTVILVGFVILTVVSFADALQVIHLQDLIARVLPLFLAFMAGALLFLFGDRVAVTPAAISAAVVVLIASTLFGVVSQFGVLPFAYLLMVVGAVLPFQRIGAKYDISYGIYIYGWPVQQMISLAFGPDLPLYLFILFAIVGTVPLAFLSCVLIEKPALELKSAAREKAPNVATL